MRPINFIAFLFIISACKSGDKTEPIALEEKKEIEIPSDFLAFYDRFHSDSIFQLDHIVFPLKSIKDDKIYTRENWIMHTPFNSQGGAFFRTYNNINGIIIEFVTEKTGFVNIERRFSKLGDVYHLIYYDIDSQFGSSQTTN